MKKIFCLSLILIFFVCSAKARAVDDKTLKYLDRFSKILFYLEKEYVEEIDAKKLIEGAIKGMVRTLDPHTSYLTEDVYKELRVDTAGKFGGVGIEIDEKMIVVSPIEGSPADKAGVEPGDKVIRIDGKKVSNMVLSEVVAKIRGSRGSKVSVTVLRNDQEMVFNLTRTMIRVPSIKSEMLDDDYGYVRIVSFQANTTDDLKDALKKLQKKKPLKGLVLDVRRNPGGLLEEAVKVSDIFLTEGVIVSTESRNKKEVDKRIAQKGGSEPTFPMIVLIDGGSASASEIVAGALQDQGRAILLGTKTFGKGSVQTIIDLEDNTALKLTIAKYFTPKGRSIQAQGIVPDIVVENVPPADKVDKNRAISEADLKGHLEVKTKEKSHRMKIADYQKKVALDYLKSWDVFKSNEQVKGK